VCEGAIPVIGVDADEGAACALVDPPVNGLLPFASFCGLVDKPIIVSQIRAVRL
jgi:hypothetical protein